MTGNDILKFLHRTPEVSGKDKLGFSPADIGTHSVRSGAVMSMFLDNSPVFLIMLVGLWSNDAFLKCAWKQFVETAKSASSRILKMTYLMSYSHFLLQLMTPEQVTRIISQQT